MRIVKIMKRDWRIDEPFIDVTGGPISGTLALGMVIKVDMGDEVWFSVFDASEVAAIDEEFEIFRTK